MSAPFGQWLGNSIPYSKKSVIAIKERHHQMVAYACGQSSHEDFPLVVKAVQDGVPLCLVGKSDQNCSTRGGLPYQCTVLMHRPLCMWWGGYGNILKSGLVANTLISFKSILYFY